MGNLVVDISNLSNNVFSYTAGVYNRNSKLSVASLTKPVTAAVLLSLVDDGLLNINDTIGTYIPSWATNGKQNVSIRHIMSHTSGVEAEELMVGTGTLENLVNTAATINLNFAPGTQVQYATGSFNVAARVVEVITGMSWKSAFEQRIRNRCGMGSAQYNPGNINPQAGQGLYCTHTEYMNFMKMLLNKGLYNGVRVLKESSINLMESDVSGGLDSSRGFGIIRNEVVNNICKEPTAESSRGCYAWLNRDKNYYCVLFTQAGYNNTIQKNIGFRNLVRSTLPNY